MERHRKKEAGCMWQQAGTAGANGRWPDTEAAGAQPASPRQRGNKFSSASKCSDSAG